MIRLREATTLALTKLRTRKVRLTVTIVISGLLFSILAGVSIAARGAFSSIAGFSNEGFANRYIAQAGVLSGGNYMSNDAVMDRALAINKEIVASKKTEAKRLGIEYAVDADPSPVEEYPGPNGTKFRNLSPNHPAAKQAIREFLAATPQVSIADLTRLADPYNAKAFYESRTLPYDLGGSRVQVLKEGQEDFDQSAKSFMGPPTGIESFSSSWTLASRELLKPFILSGQNLETGSDGSVPIIIPVSAAEELLKLKKLPSSASSNERLERTREIRDAAKDIRFTICYRNDTSIAQVEQAVATQKEIELNKNKKDYRKPSLQYGLPEACGAAPVIRDVRSKEQKTLDAKQEQFDQKFGKLPAAQSTLAFRVVGLVPDADYSPSTSVTQIIKSLVTSSLGNGWYTPLEPVTQNPLISQLFFNADLNVTSGPPVYYAEFGEANQARRFIDKENCTPDYSNYRPMSAEEAKNTEDPAQKCVNAGKPFGIGPYGSNSLGLESAKRGFGKIFGIAGAVVAVIACIIMMGTVGKMIADSRRETAVFRAIGAKKLDIAQIYLLYTLMLSALITVFAVLVGLGAALWVDAKWSAEITQHALVAYNAQDLSREFKLYSFYLPDMLYLLAIAVGAGLLSALFPLIRSLRRNPIRDMRDDT
jgi:hypothetical protein